MVENSPFGGRFVTATKYVVQWMQVKGGGIISSSRIAPTHTNHGTLRDCRGRDCTQTEEKLQNRPSMTEMDKERWATWKIDKFDKIDEM